MDISQRIEGGSLKLTTLVDHCRLVNIRTSISSRMHFRVTNVFYYNCFLYHFFYS